MNWLILSETAIDSKHLISGWLLTIKQKVVMIGHIWNEGNCYDHENILYVIHESCLF